MDHLPILNQAKKTIGFSLITALSFYGTIYAQITSKSLTFTPKQLCVDNNEACDIADINQDGLLDVVAGRLWYAAPDFIPRPLRSIGLHPPDYARNNGEHILDVDRNGWPDVVTTGWSETRILWYENPGAVNLQKGIPWLAHTLADVGHGQAEIGSLKDLDGDGLPEYIINSYVRSNPLTVWQLDHDAETPNLSGVEIGPRGSHGIGFGDINGDNRMDILIDEGWYEQPGSGIGSGDWTWHRDWNLGSASCPMQIVDLNEDGRNDVIWGRGHGYGLYWMEQGEPTGDSTIWTQHLIDSTWSQVHALAWVDLDRDGQNELLAGKRIWAHSGKDPGSQDPAYLYRYIWVKSSQSFQRHAITDGNIGTGLFFKVADLNVDGKKDILVAGKTGTYILWQD